MAIKTFINGQENGVITYLGDTEPCAVYVNGERQDNISYIPDVAEGVDTVSYKSEYKNNLRTLQIEGNTEQEGGLPSAYQQVEYIESTNAQYIDTGVVASINTKIVSRVQMNYTQSTANKGRSGMILGGSKGWVCFGDYGQGNLVAYFSTTGLVGAEIPFDTEWHTYNLENGLQKIDDVTATNTVTGTIDGLSLYLLNVHIGWTGQTIVSSQRLAYAQIWDNGTLVRDYIPCYRKTDNVIGLYDLVNRVFYTNQGTGTFLKGKDILTTINPTIANPTPITNCGNGQIEVVVKGTNEFDISKIKPTSVYAGIHISNVGENSITITSYNSQSSNGYCDARVKLNVACPNIVVGKRYKFTFVSGGVSKIIYLSGSDVSWQSGTIKTITDAMLNSYVVFYGHNFGVYPNVETPVSVVISDIIITEVQDADYEPYIEPTTVTIPANVVLESGANETLLELAKIGDYADTITIDRVNNEVKYIQRICRVRPFENVGGTLSYGGGSAGTHNIWTFALDKTSKPYITPVCEFARVLNDDDYATLGADEFGVFFAYEDYVYIYIPSSLGINSLQALEDYLTQTQGERLSIEYVLFTPIERTITDEMEAGMPPANLKTNLLEWARNTKNQTNIIEITSTPSVTKTSVNYAKWGGVPNENNT